MSKKDPIEKSKYIDDHYKAYLRSSFAFDGNLQSLFEQQLEQEELFKGTYVALDLPFERGHSLQELMNEGEVCRSFAQLGDVNLQRPLYWHQERAIRHICSGHSAIVTTGTGSGKTECFLYPILNELLRDIEQGNHEVGVRAIFLYPMNALVNDQIERVRKLLTPYPDITYGFFTGDTPERAAQNYRQTYGEENETYIPENELVSREEIRQTPPHLLFTNYSMLEYLMIRPNDYAIFTPERLRNWKFVVLDEAHTYNGSLGIEISLLLRRITGMADRKPRFILTSATLGEQGKSEKDIVSFAENLTSAQFDEKDIIFSKRIPYDVSSLKYTIDGEDYIALDKAGDNAASIAQIASRYTRVAANGAWELLYELLLADNNAYHLYDTLKHGSKTFQEILHSYNESLNRQQLVALIDLINRAEKDGGSLFSLRYHSFVRPLNGAYVTLGENPQLRLTKTNSIDGLKAFEVGNCKYCNTPYIIGKIQMNTGDGLEHLVQNNEVDIYENYGDNAFIRLDYFLLNDHVDDSDEDDTLEPHRVCAKCGAISNDQNLNARRCSCDSFYQHMVYRVNRKKKDDGEGAYNNITQCPHCGRSSTAGIVKSLNLGKDEGTALIGEMLFEALDEQEQEQRTKGKLSLKAGISNARSIAPAKTKQFLAFSDSRQQASYFAVFLDSTHARILRKRLIWKVIEDNHYRDIAVDEMAAYLTDMIKNRDLTTNDLSPHKNAWITIMADLLKIDGNYDGEGVGLYYFDLDLSEIMDQISEEDVSESYGAFGITKADLENIMQVVLGEFKTTPAINYVKSTLTPDEKKEELGYRRFDNYIMYECPKTIKNTKSFLPIKSEDNRVVRYVMKVCECDSSTAKDILDVIFNNLAVEGGLLKPQESKKAYQIDASKYVIKNYRTSKFYRCSKCGRLTPYNVHGKCVQDKCDGTLSEVDPDVTLASNHYRNQYKNKKIEKIVVKEHTAQLDRKKAKLYQKDFKNKRINILSCSTTFEMGIDIGDLETVFMRNVPPSPANYVQRAGRAGRRKDSAAYVLTYCGTGSHDYTYFCEPEKMISGVIRPPYFDVHNKKIITRHLMAACLGYFFRQNPEYIKSVGTLVFGDGEQRFNDYVSSHPSDLGDYIDHRILPGDEYSEYHNFKWFDSMGGSDEKFVNMVNKISSIVDEYEKAQNEAIADEQYAEADYYKRQIKGAQEENVIEDLSSYCVIPKYGFPVDVVELQIYKEGKLNLGCKPDRDLKIAISEYAPDSEIIVDGNKYTSKYITLPKVGDFPQHYFCTCPSCKKVNVYLSDRTATECKHCGEDISTVPRECYIEPIYGFKTGITKEGARMKPKRSYAGDVSYMGGGKKDEQVLDIGGAIRIETTTNDELLVINKSPFYMCPKCGYSEIVKGRVQTPTKVSKHKNFRQFDCEGEELKQVRLGHSFQTDVARITIPALTSYEEHSFSQALSFMYALLEGISISFNINRTDIDGVLELNLEQGSYDILVYDNVPGGAGHVKRLIDKDAMINALKCTYEKVSQRCCDENTSCYNCLRNYYNQTYHGRLVRKYARDFAEELLREVGYPVEA